jgi:hypothetical protein
LDESNEFQENRMEKILAACGNDCASCPRHLPKREAELRHTAELWMKIGYRDHVVSNEEISCTGCTTDNWCRYNVIQCTTKRKISDCGKCPEYPCANIAECFEVTKSFAPMCRKVCTEEEYETLKKAFFEKKENLSTSSHSSAIK